MRDSFLLISDNSYIFIFSGLFEEVLALLIQYHDK
jgi:hypothetical protein